MSDILDLIIKSCSCIMTVLSLIAVLVKPIREKILNVLDNKKCREEIRNEIKELREIIEEQKKQNELQQKELEKQSSAIVSSIRNNILSIYLEKLDKEHITAYELENIEHLYEDYKKMGGNSFVSNCVENLRSKNIKN